MAFWFRGSADDIARNPWVLSLSQLTFTPSPVGKGDYVLSFGLRKLGHQMAPPKGSLFDDRWHHVAVSIDFRTASDNVVFYLDGALTGLATYPIKDLYKDGFKSTRVDQWHLIGARKPGQQAFSGCLDEVVAFDRALSTDDVMLLYRGPTPGQRLALARPPLEVDAGNDQAIALPARQMRVRGSVKGSSRDLVLRWEQVSGPGKVLFSNPAALDTGAAVAHAFEAINPGYAEYVLRLTATPTDGPPFSDDTVVSFYTPSGKKTRTFSKLPPPGVHPRVLFASADLPGMRTRVRNVAMAARALEVTKARVWGRLSDAADPFGHIYAALRDGESDVDAAPGVVAGQDTYANLTGGGSLYGHLYAAALIALVEDDTARLEELAGVLARLAERHLAFYEPDYDNKLTHDISGTLGMAYDLLHNSMTESQRHGPRELLSRMTRFRQSYGVASRVDADNSTNWRGVHDFMLLAALAIEGEPGYDPRIYETHKRKQREFLTKYGVFPSGCAHEGWGYFNFCYANASLSALAVAHRDENFFETTNLPRAIDMMFRQVAPWDRAIRANGDVISGRIGNAQPLTWVARYMYPEDPVAGYLQDGLTEGLIDGSGDQRGLNALALLFAMPKDMSMTQKQAAEANTLPLDVFCKDTGLMSCRSDWSDEAVHLTFRCRTDKYFLGHMHPDVNSFELWALGREWFIDPGKAEIHNDLHATVLIDGVGGGGSLNWWTWPSLPGIFESFEPSDSVVAGTGNAKPFYDYTPSPAKGTPQALKGTRAPDLKAEPVLDHGLTWKTFMDGDDTEKEVPYWREKAVGYDFAYVSGVKPLYSYNPVAKARRTATLVRGQHPFVVIIDDIRKDERPHAYTWIGNMPSGDIVVESRTASSMVLRHKADADGGPRLLVELLACRGDAALELEEFVIPSTTIAVTRLSISVRNVVSPDFAVLLLPHCKGRELPAAVWNTARDILTAQLQGRKRAAAMERP